ncbi:hypothetical protein EQV97_04945 [Pseudomonas sp. TMW22090]|uniref:IpaC/SipC family type III secretion system effector n=1 Tax=Pseudomonas sp. TMW22090 TaxID=2506434 RepID=UPI001F0E4207|nr:IpaC/SipC family type III secretion system effector [Pseudomonas sp. TMW22090]MCH4876734.1 hypothetical protein [Pseudomonas sp. TMW22090]
MTDAIKASTGNFATGLDAQVHGKAAVQRMPFVSMGTASQLVNANAQVLPPPSEHTLQELADMYNGPWTEAQKELVDGFKQEFARQGLGAETSSLTIDPAAWDKRSQVLVAAVVALYIARQSSVATSAVFTKLAYQAAQAQGVAIRAGGEAAMRAAIAGSVVSGVTAAGGAGLSLRGHAKQHADIKTNKVEATNRNQQAQELKLELQKTPSDTTAEQRKTTVVRASGEVDVIEQHNHGGKLDPGERATLEAEARIAADRAKQASLQSDLNQKGIDSDKTIGGALTGVSHSLSAGVSGIVRLEEYSQRQEETSQQAQQGVHKSVSDTAGQAANEDSVLLNKLLEALLQLGESRNATISTIANARA